MKPHRRRRSLPVIAGAWILALTSPFSASAAPPSAPPQPPSSAGADGGPTDEHTITLITGDVVTTRQATGADGKRGGVVTVRGADGRPTQTHITELGDDLYAYPESALPFVAQGILDRQLFNITDLIADGYDDAHRKRLPLIVSYTKADAARRASAVPEGATRVRNLDSIQGAALTADRSRADTFWNSVAGASTADGARAQDAEPSFGRGIARIWLDGLVHADLAESTGQIGAPQVWADGNTGQGVDVAVLDTGVDAGHPDLADRIAARQSFVPDENTDDHSGHGTHVASTIAGTGAASDGKEKGVAPGSRLRIGKVLGNAGSGLTSWVLAGMEWAAVDQRAKVVNMSLGSDQWSDGTDPLSQAADRLSAETGALFVTAAGNAGIPGGISGPGAANAALTVGAVDSTDSVPFFSSTGPRVDGALKPEISAPGVDILAANSQFSDNGLGSYQTLSGTSMATPHVAGAAALLAAARPELTGGQLKDLLTSSSQQTRYNAFDAGSGRLDVAAASRTEVFATATAYAAQGTGAAVQRPVTYTNTTDAPVTLALSVTEAHAPAGTFRLSASQVVVPAQGTADVKVTIDSSGITDPGRYTGQVLAKDTAGNVAAHTAVGVGFVARKLTLTFKDAKAEPMSGVAQVFRSGDAAGPMYVVIDSSGTGQIYVPKGIYSVLAFKTVEGVHGPHSKGMALLGDPEVRLDADTTVTLDASKIKRIDTTTPQRTEVTYQRLDYHRSMGGVILRDYMETQTNFDSLWAQPATDKVTHGDFYLAARWRKEQPALAVSTRTADFTDVLRQDGVTPLPTGTRKLPLVFAGQGARADYAYLDVRDKAVVIRRNDDVSDIDQAANAMAAGAKLMLVVNNEDGRGFRGYNQPFGPPVTLDVGLLSPDEGEKLVQQAKLRNAEVSVASQPVSPYVYDLMQTWHNQIPDHMVVQGSAKNLARVDVTFGSPAPSRAGGEFRFDWPKYNNWAIGGSMPEPTKGKRTDWVSTGGDYSWSQEAYAEGVIYEVEPKTSYRAGSTQSQEWFKPIQRPFLNDAFRQPTRKGNFLYIDIPGWGSRNHVGMDQSGAGISQQQTLYQGSTQLGQGNFTSVWGDAPSADKLPYRLVVTGERKVTFTPYSSSTRTEWDFTSKARTDDSAAVLPLVQLEYGIGTDGAGRAGRHHTLSVTAAHLPDAAGAGKIGAVGLELSYDEGRTWHKADCGSDGRFRLGAPRKASFVSLRANAKDAAGNAVRQTVIKAFGLR
ncbi:S8 family serine peptidase [Streptomyces sp. NPDC059861]|uniref:S8 family peptidase n=1 Tax=Streptomyces sp. NPDC059861 TaxID=3346974 RepID=UPI00364EFD53